MAGAEQAYLDLVSGRRRGLGPSLLLGALRLLAGGYYIGLVLRDLTYRLGLVRPVRVSARVITVGNLTMGGTGKTPAVIHLAEQHRAAGERVAVLIRGHRGRRSDGVNVVHDGQRLLLDAAEAGDEAVLIARRLGDVPVLAGKDRRKTARAAVERFGATLLLLDDGFQYRRLAVDHPIVLLDATRPFGLGGLFPSGTLRDPPSYLARAAEVWVTRTDHPDAVDLDALEARVRRLAPGVPVRRTVHAPARLTTRSGEPVASAVLAGATVGALAGIGNPAAFAATLAGLGTERVVPFFFADHHRFTPAELAEVAESARAKGCAAVVTTEKDAVRLEAWPPEAPPLWVLGIELAFGGG